MKPSIVLVTLAFGLVLAGVTFLLGYQLLGLPAGRALAVGGLVGLVQAAGSLIYLWLRFVRGGPRPRDGGMPG